MMITTMMWLFDVVRPDGDTAPLDQYAETGSECSGFRAEAVYLNGLHHL